MSDDEETLSDDGIMVESDEQLCPWSENLDEHRRVFVLIHFGDSMDLEKMDKVTKWLKDGVVPPKLRSVKE